MMSTHASGTWTACWCLSGGRHSSALFCFSCQESWAGWKLAVFPGTCHHVSYLTGSLTCQLFRQIYLGRFPVALQISSSLLAPRIPPVCGQHLCRFQGLVTSGVLLPRRASIAGGDLRFETFPFACPGNPLLLHAPEFIPRRQFRDPEGGLPRGEL